MGVNRRHRHTAVQHFLPPTIVFDGGYRFIIDGELVEVFPFGEEGRFVIGPCPQNLFANHTVFQGDDTQNLLGPAFFRVIDDDAGLLTMGVDHILIGNIALTEI